MNPNEFLMSLLNMICKTISTLNLFFVFHEDIYNDVIFCLKFHRHVYSLHPRHQKLLSPTLYNLEYDMENLWKFLRYRIQQFRSSKIFRSEIAVSTRSVNNTRHPIEFHHFVFIIRRWALLSSPSTATRWFSDYLKYRPITESITFFGVIQIYFIASRSKNPISMSTRLIPCW